MKGIQTVTLMVTILTSATVAGAQGPTNTVGIPISSAGNPGGATLALVDFGIEGQVNPVGEPGVFPFSTVFPGDRVLVNGTGGNDPSNWLADIRFFNPADPTGSLGLPATVTQAYFPRDAGVSGFAAFKLFPKINFTPASIDRFGSVVGTDSLFGPVGGIFSGQLAVVNFIALPAASAVPEPGNIALLSSLGIAGGLFALSRLRRRRSKSQANGDVCHGGVH